MDLKVNLVLLGILMTTWARSVDHRSSLVINEEPEDSRDASKNYFGEKEAAEKRENNEAYDEALMKKYARIEAEKLIRMSSKLGGKRRRSLHGNEDKVDPSFSARRLEKMLEKAILKIITGDLSTADMLLLKSLNYSLEEVLSVRERELRKKNLPTFSPTKFHSKVDTVNGKSFGETSGWSRANQVENYDEKSIKRNNQDFDFDAYNRQAVYDYETTANKITPDLESVEASLDYDNERIRVPDADDLPGNERAPQSHVVFKIRYDDSEFDSSSNEKAIKQSRDSNGRFVTRHHRGNTSDDHRSRTVTLATPISNFHQTFSNKDFATPSINPNPTQSSTDGISSLANRFGNSVTHDDEFDNGSLQEITESADLQSLMTDPVRSSSSWSTPTSDIEKPDDGYHESHDDDLVNETFDESKRKNIYEGLEWVEDDVYRVIPEAIDSLNYYDASINDMENGTSDDSELNGTRDFEIRRKIEDDDGDDDSKANDTIGYQNENPQEEANSQTESFMRNSPDVNLSTYQQLAIAHRRDGNITSPFDSQGQKAIEDIKLKVLAMTGRFNLSSSGNQVQRERLTMFSPICQLPRNTDAEAWSDPFSMNMNFQLNLTSGNHVVAAKVRIYVLPQSNITVSTAGATDNEDEEEKIRISIYFYTKSLKKHRSKKRLIDSIVVSLTTQGSHCVLDVRQALRFWRQNLRNSHNSSNNHGLVIQVEDQDGRSLKPAQYIQQDSCHVSEMNSDEKAYQRVPALFVQACTRYVRVVNGEPVTYVNCRKTSRKVRH